MFTYLIKTSIAMLYIWVILFIPTTSVMYNPTKMAFSAWSKSGFFYIFYFFTYMFINLQSEIYLAKEELTKKYVTNFSPKMRVYLRTQFLSTENYKTFIIFDFNKLYRCLFIQKKI